jgi:hypothetical protein
VVLEGADSLFGGIATVITRRDKLVFDVGCGEEVTERGGAFIVEFL